MSRESIAISAKMSDIALVRCKSENEKDVLIKKLLNETDDYKKMLDSIQQERDNLLCEVNRLKFELQMTDLKRLREDDLYENSAPVKQERGYCSSGGRNIGPQLTKANSLSSSVQHHHHALNGGSHHSHISRRPQAVSQSSMLGGSRHGASNRGIAQDDSVNRNERWRRNVSHSNGQAYELSQDLADKRLEMLEKRYGGDRARRAATTIQRAYRHYAMTQKFRAITATAKAAEKRLSRRFTIESEWDMSSQSSMCSGNNFDAPERIRSEFDKLNRNLNASAYGESRAKPLRSVSMRDSTSSRSPKSAEYENVNLNDTSLYCHSPSNDSTSSARKLGMNGISLDHSFDGSSPFSSRELKYGQISEDGKNCSSDSGHNSSKSSRSSKSSSCKNQRKVPPEVPRRSSSIKSDGSSSVDSFTVYPNANHRSAQCDPPSLTPPSSTPSSLASEGGSDRAALRRSTDNGSLSSVQSSGSDSSLSHSDRGTPISQNEKEEFAHPTSPIWKRKALIPEFEDKRLSNISENSEDSGHSVSSDGATYSQCIQSSGIARHFKQQSFNLHDYKISEVLRKRRYRVGLNLFNKKPEKGINYLIARGFLENSPQAVAKFLLSRKGLSKQMIGEYLGNIQNSLNMSVLECFSSEIDLSGMQVDVALRQFQANFRMPGEAQKIERLMQIFAQRYCQCNRDIVAKLKDPETVFVLAFAIIMLNTDLHTASLKPEKRMKVEDFIKNLRGVDDGMDIESEMLEGMYYRIKAQEFRPGHDHVTQVLKAQQSMIGKIPQLALPHRRLVCYCRLYEIPTPNKKERAGLHQREVFLFNDLLVITKIFSKKNMTYTFRQSFPLAGLSVTTNDSQHYSFLLEVRQRVDNKLLITLNARNEVDRVKFCEDLKESIMEMDEMESLRIEGELERQKANLRTSRPNSTAENRDSGVADMEIIEKNCSLNPESTLKRTALSNSLLDIHESDCSNSQLKGSVTSLDAAAVASLPIVGGTLKKSVSDRLLSEVSECHNRIKKVLPISISLGDLSKQQKRSLPNYFLSHFSRMRKSSSAENT